MSARVLTLIVLMIASIAGAAPALACSVLPGTTIFWREPPEELEPNELVLEIDLVDVDPDTVRYVYCHVYQFPVTVSRTVRGVFTDKTIILDTLLHPTAFVGTRTGRVIVVGKIEREWWLFGRRVFKPRTVYYDDVLKPIP